MNFLSKEFSSEERKRFINFIEEKDKLFRKENNYFSVVWEKCLTSEYWKNWREKIKTLSDEEIDFYVKRVLKLRSRILWIIRSYRKDKWSDDYTKKLFEIEEREIQSITKEEFYGNKPRDGIKKLTNQEVLSKTQKNSGSVSILAIVSVVSVLLIGSVVIAKKKLNKKIKKV